VISVILPSRNGADTLPDTLAALAALEPPPGGHEIVLVDNASDDGTLALLERFAREHGARLLREPTPGKSRALNRAIGQARGELLVFVDDDVIVPPGWLRAYDRASRDHPAAGLFAGALAPAWRQPPPAWLAGLAAEGRCCGATPKTLAEGPCAPGVLKGANFAVRREALGEQRFAGGAADFGSGPRTGGEDSELARRIVRSGIALVHVPAAWAGHIVQPDEMTPAAVFARYRRIGSSQAPRRPRLPGALADMLAAAGFAAGAAGALLLGARLAAARHLIRVASRLGRVERALRCPSA